MDSGNGNGCVRGEEGTNSILCSCNIQDFCTDDENLPFLTANTHEVEFDSNNDLYQERPTTINYGKYVRGKNQNILTMFCYNILI